MARAPFRRNSWPTLGVELELQLIDARTLALRSAIAELLAALPPAWHDSVKPEFMQCYVEINSEVGRTVGEVGTDLARKVRAVERAADGLGLRLFWGATHPFSRWQDQRITPDERYCRLAEQLQETVIRGVTFGLHVHVGVDSGDTAIRVGDRLGAHLPILLAMSANSPFWHGRRTGHHAYRVEALEVLPTGGVPPRMRSWEDYEAVVGQLQAAGFIDSRRELWWDVRPNPEHGTIEVRICDMPPDLASVLALTALIQCLVHDLARATAGVPAESDWSPLMIRQNRWRAYRAGLGATLVDPRTLEARPARELAGRLIEGLLDTAGELGCARHLGLARDLVERPNGAERQIALFEEYGDLAAVVDSLAATSRLSPGPPIARWAPALPAVAPLEGFDAHPRTAWPIS
ncbi:MAG TPA: YbdK family carboxylate-amine ligase [Isosphaeraceae bacterium]|jgi:carboxylate-amine ligase|nr:YbdK family carboxylate-amine ligase [Isosphaeraceae bacterium]